MTSGLSRQHVPSSPASPLRVLVVAPTPFFGDRGCHVRIYEEVRALSALGVECRVVTYPTGGDLDDVDIVRAPPVFGIAAAPLGFSTGRPVLDLSLLLVAHRESVRFRPHLLHAHLHEGIAIGVALRARHGVPLVADLQGSLVAELVDQRVLADAGVAASIVRRVEGWLVRRPTRVLTSSSHGATLLAAQGVDRRILTTLPDGVDIEVFCPGSGDPEMVQRLGLTGKRVVVFLGVLTDYQGVDVLLDVAAILARSDMNAHLLVLGYPNEAHYQAAAARRGLDGIMTFPGRVPYAEAPSWLRLGEVAVSPKRSLTEANGKLLNYMACGLPVVATDTPVNRELLGDHGVFAPVGDAEQFAALILDLLADASRARGVGQALRDRAESMFSWKAIASRLETVYRDTIAGRTPR